jgi:hypothetical protein|tara:strand:+ start:1784 stop:2164 length:381 start_codon:yes stop_codon:yes gene_type:complete
MRLNEFVEPAEDQALAASIIAVSNHLQQQVETGEIDPDNYTVDNLLDLFQSQDIVIDVQDLYTMIDKPLLKGIISNIQGDKVVFKGDEPVSMDSNEQPDDSQKVVANMANSAMKSRPDLPGGIKVI